MQDRTIEHSHTSRLAKLLGLKVGAVADWLPTDLAEVLRHQLARPLQADLRATAADEITIAHLAALAGPNPARSFADLLHHPQPPVELLRLVKEFARLGRDSGTIPADVAAMLYYASIATALVRCGVRITEFDDRTLVKGLQWARSRLWADEPLRAIATQCLDSIGNAGQAGTPGTRGTSLATENRRGASEVALPAGSMPERDPAVSCDDETVLAVDSPDTTPVMSMPGAAATAVVPDLPGYRFIRLLGRGAMGEVWQAVQISTQRDVAVKLMGDQVDSDKARALFDREVELTANLEHPNIARVYDGGHYDGTCYYVMELIRGLPFDRYVAEASLDRPAMLRMFATICLAVDYAHLRGVIHRDLKPSNVMVDDAGRPRVGDFGLAKLAARAGPVSGHREAEVEGEIVGTPAYMSPEQAAGHSLTLDTRTDVYSLGVILYRLLTSRFPHDVSGSTREVLGRIIEEEMTPPRAVADVDGDLEAMLLKALARDRERRYDTAGALARDIENYLGGKPLNAGPSTTRYFVQKWFLRHRFEASVSAAVAVSLLAMGVYSYIRVALALNTAVSAQHVAVIERTAAEDAKKSAIVRLAEAEVSEGDSKASHGSWEQAVGLYRRAHDDYVNAGASPLSSDLGLWAADRACPPPLCRISDVQGTIMGAAFIPGAPQVVTAGADGQLRTWDLVTGRQLACFRDMKGPTPSAGDDDAGAFTCVDACSDGNSAVTGSRDGVMRVWDLRTGDVRLRLRPPGPPGRWVRRVAVGGHRTALALCVTCDPPFAGNSPDGLTLWDLDQGRLMRNLPEAGQVVAAAFSHDGTHLLTAGSKLCLWDVASGDCLYALDCGSVQASAVAFSPRDGAAVVGFESAGAGAAVKVLTDPAHPESLRGLAPSTGPVCGVGFAADNGPILVADGGGTVRVLDLATGGEISRCTPAPSVPRNLGAIAPGDDLDASPGSEPAAALSPDGRLGLLFWDKEFAVWDMHPGPEMRLLEVPKPSPTSAADLAFVGGGRLLLARVAGIPALWDVPTGKRLLVPQFDAQVSQDASRSQIHSALAIDSTGNVIAVLQGDRVSVWRLDDVQDPFLLWSFKIAVGSTQTWVLAVSGSDRVVTAGAGNDLVLWDARTGNVQANLKGNAENVLSVAFSPDGRWLLSGCKDGSASLWDLSALPASAAISASRQLRRAGHNDGVNAVAFSHDGAWAATGSGNSLVDVRGDNTVRLWDPIGGRLVREMRGHWFPVRSVAFSPDGRLVVSADESGMLKLWSTERGQELRSLDGHAGPVDSVAFSNDGTLIASADTAGTIRIWDIGTPALRQKLEPNFIAACQALGKNPNDADALRACGRWYEFRRAPRWAADAFRRGQASSTAIPTASLLNLARSDWEAGNPRAASEEFQRVIDAGTIDNSYNLRLCRDTAAEESRHITARRPATRDNRR